MTARTYNTLFLCTGNSARSIMAESLLNVWGRKRFRAFSAGSHPTGTVHPLALQLLDQMRMPLPNARSKDWSEFTGEGAPQLDFVFTVCDAAAGESCPVFPGQPMSAHWGVPDPAAVEGDETVRMLAFRNAFRQLENRIKLFTALPLQSIDRVRLQKNLDDIGRTADAGTPGR